MSETCQKLAFTHPIVVLKSGLKNNWMKKLDRVNRPLWQHFSQISLETEYNAVLVINYTILRGYSSSSVQPIEILNCSFMSVSKIWHLL